MNAGRRARCLGAAVTASGRIRTIIYPERPVVPAPSLFYALVAFRDRKYRR
jgi:hypothetical protein